MTTEVPRARRRGNGEHRRPALVLACVFGASALRCSLIDTDGLAGGGAGAPDASSEERSSSEAATPDASVAEEAGTAEVVASGQTGAFGLARLGATLYWTSANSGNDVSSCPLDHCVQPSVVASGAKATVIVAATRVYWITPGKPSVSFTVDGAPNGELALSAPGVWLATGANAVFASQSNGQVVRLQGDPPFSTTTFLGFDPNPDRLSANGAALAWTASSGGRDNVGYCGSGGCDASTSVVAQNEGPVAVALDASFLFWTTADGRIRSAAHDGKSITSSARDVATGFAEPAALAPDEASPFLYFVARGTPARSYLDGMVGKVAKSGGAVTVLASDQARPASVLVTETHVYWANEYDGTIRRALK